MQVICLGLSGKASKASFQTTYIYEYEMFTPEMPSI